MNFDPQVSELMKETVYLKKMDLEIPEAAKNLILLESKIDNHITGVRNILERYKKLIEKIPKDLIPLMRPSKENVELALKPGLHSVTWVSTNIEECKLFFIS